MTTETNAHSNIPLPAGAVTGEWHDVGGGALERYFEGAQRVVDADEDCPDAVVVIAGFQLPDGNVSQRRIVLKRVSHYVDELTARQARDLARELIAAADESQRLDQVDGTKS